MLLLPKWLYNLIQRQKRLFRHTKIRRHRLLTLSNSILHLQTCSQKIYESKLIVASTIWLGSCFYFHNHVLPVINNTIPQPSYFHIKYLCYLRMPSWLALTVIIHPLSKGILTKFEICLILALAQVAYSDQRYFSMSIALISAVDKFIVDGANVFCSCIQKK